MILTDSFVVLNFPRTGSTFVRSALRRMYGPWWNALGFDSPPRPSRGFRELLLPIDRTRKAERLGRTNQHGRWGQIPESHRHLPVASVIRHPLDHAVSHFMHDDWWKSPPADEALLRLRFPSWPRLAFGEYLEFEHEFALPDVLKDSRPPAEIGTLTAHFVRFFARDPDAALAGLTDTRIDSGEVARDLPPIRWLRHEHLLDDLTDFLRETGHSSREVGRVRRHPRVNVSRARGGRSWRDFYTPGQEALKRHRERTLFVLFPAFDP
jgi:hypothetical protein